MTIKITYDLLKNSLVIEGEEGNLVELLKKVQELIPNLGTVSIIRPSFNQLNLNPSLPGTARVDAPSEVFSRDLGPREFARKLPVDTAFDRIAVLAYYACKIRGKPTFTVKEMGDWFGLCGFQKPAQMAVSMTDARRKKEYIDSKGRDQWFITTIGENFVMNLIEGNRPE